MRLHCHSFLVKTKTRIVHWLNTICPVKNRWGGGGGAENIDCALAVWENMIMAVLQHRVPTREIRMKSQRKMWMTSELYHLSKRKFRLFKIARSTRSEDDWSKYARFRNFCTSRFRSAKANFLRRKHEEISSATDGSHR